MADTYHHLRNFIQNRMRMQHIYQPVMLRTLLRNGGSANVNQIARSILAKDLSQVEYYEQITKTMVGRVLTDKDGIAEKIKEGRKIAGYRIPKAESMDSSEINSLISLCEEKIQEYVQKRTDLWDHRKPSARYIPGTLRYEVLKRAKFRCELCGISAEGKGLEVDHIAPRNRDGSNDISNLQALCYSCNAMKRDHDDTDFRQVADSYDEREEGCLFCDVERSRTNILGDAKEHAENELCFAIWDNYPVTDKHVLVIPKRHVSDFFELYQPEINAVHTLLTKLRQEIRNSDSTVTGFNVGINSGEDAGQTIPHCHIHLIPRRKGDAADARGGVRGVIPDKRLYEDI